MFGKKQKFVVLNLIVIMLLLGGLFGVTPAKAGYDSIPEVKISTPSYPVGIKGGQSRLVTYSFTESGNVSGTITSRSYRFYTQSGEPLSDTLGPYPTHVKVNALAADEWNELVYLPKAVMEQARSLDEYAFVLKTNFFGTSMSGVAFSTEASLLLLLPPAAFSKATPVDGGSVPAANPSLHWNGSVGAIDYEYCFDTIDNNSCDTDWTGTYWLGTYGTDVALQDLPSDTTFYWQVRANNMAGATYADKGNWWAFHPRAASTLIVTSLNDSGAGSLRQAIADANPGDTIVFDPDLAGQTITVASPLWIDKGMTIDGSDLSARININGNNQTMVFRIGWCDAMSCTVTLKGLDVEAGYSAGGSIFVSGELNVIDVNFTGNGTDDYGGAIYNDGVLNVINSNFVDNHARTGGGAIGNYGQMTIAGSAFRTNSATIFWGGAVYNANQMIVIDSLFTGNHARNGGAIYTRPGYSFAYGVVAQSTFTENTADAGGGVYNEQGGVLQITNSTFSGNEALDYGGGIFMDTGELSLDSSTLTNNSSNGTGGALYSRDSLGQGTSLSLTNSILANSPVGTDCHITNTVITSTHNLIETNAGGANSCGIPFIAADPRLGLLEDNGGPTQTHALLPDSPAINAGDDASCPDADQRGVSRPQGSHCDIGAYEYEDHAPPQALSSLPADPNPTSASSVSFDMKFSEAVTGVDAADFALVTANLTGTAITEVSGSGADYTVTVGTGRVRQVNGTIRLNVVDNDSILDAVGNPLGGSGTGNGNFTSEDDYIIAGHVAQPALLFPPRNNYTTGDTTPDFRWKSVTDASRYQIVFATDKAFNNPQEYFENGTSFTFETPLPAGTYYWRVRAHNILDQPGDWSTFRYFTIDTVPPLPPLLRFPAHNASVRGSQTFRWAPVRTAVQYEFQLATDVDFSDQQFSVIQRLTHRRLPGNLRGTYYWRVRAQDEAGNWSAWSDVFTVTITSSR